MAITQDYQVEFNGLVLGQGTAYDIVALLGTGIPSVRSIDVERQDDHGTFPTKRELIDARSFNIEVDVIATDPTNLWENVNALKRAFAPNDTIRPLLLRFAATGWGLTASDVVRTSGYVRQFTSNLGDPLNFNTAKAYIQVVCPDPRVYSIGGGDNEARIDVGSVTGGWSFPWTFPWTFGTSTPGFVDLVNQGYFPTHVTWLFYGPSVNPRVTDLNTGKFLQWDLELFDGDFLVVQGLDKSVLLNGTSQRYSARAAGSKWFQLQPGSNPVQYSHALGTGHVIAQWNSASI